MQRGFLSERKGRVIPCRGSENRKGAETNGGESSTRSLEAESIRSRPESTGGCVKLKTVTDIRFFLHVKHCQQRKSYQQSGTQTTKSQPYVIYVSNYICFMLSCTDICRLCIYYGPSFCCCFFLPKSQVLCNSVSTTRKIRLMLKAFDSLLAYCYHCHNCHWYRYQTLRRQGGMEKTAELYSSCRLTFSRGDREGDYTSQSTFSMDRHERKSWHSPLHHSLVKQQKTPTAG